MTQPQATPWHILGPGAIGSLWASYLLRAGHAVTLLCHTPEQLDGFWDNPSLTLVADDQRYKYQPETESINHSGPIAKLLITTKSYATEAAVRGIAHRIGPQTVILVLQNGMGPQQRLAEQFSQAPVYAGTTTEGAYRTGPQQVVHAGHGETWLGPLNTTAAALDATPLAELLALELPSRYDRDISTRLWQKLAINCAINGLTAIHDCRNGALTAVPAYRQQMQTLCEEFSRVAEALQQPLFEDSLFDAAQAVAEATADNISSLLQDVRHNRDTEIDFLNGFLCTKAAELGIKVPAHQQLRQQVLQLSSTRTFTLNPNG